MNNEFTAKTVEGAIAEGLSALNISREQAEITVLDQGGFLRKAKVSIVKKKTEGERALAFVEQLTEKMGFSCVCELEEDEETAKINVIGTDTGAIIGHRGDVLDAIQYLASLVANREKAEFKRIVVDCENYREKRKGSLKALATRLADKAERNARRVRLEPMNPYERRIIHAALSEDERVTTTSEGEEPSRYVVIIPKNEKRFSRDRNDRRGGRDHGRNDRRNDRRNRGPRRDSSSAKGTAMGMKKENRPAPKTSGFSSFGTYLGNTRTSGFSEVSEESFERKDHFGEE